MPVDAYIAGSSPVRYSVEQVVELLFELLEKHPSQPTVMMMMIVMMMMVGRR